MEGHNIWLSYLHRVCLHNRGRELNGWANTWFYATGSDRGRRTGVGSLIQTGKKEELEKQQRIHFQKYLKASQNSWISLIKTNHHHHCHCHHHHHHHHQPVCSRCCSGSLSHGRALAQAHPTSPFNCQLFFKHLIGERFYFISSWTGATLAFLTVYCSLRQVEKLTRWQDDRVTWWQGDKSTRWQGGRVTRWQSDKATRTSNSVAERAATRRFLR